MENSHSPELLSFDKRWADFVKTIRRDTNVPFSEHWALFEQLSGDRRPEDGPQPAWYPGDERTAHSNVNAAQTEHGFASYRDLHDWSVEHPEAFWSFVLDRLGIRFRKRADAILELGDRGTKDSRWLVGAQMNIADGCFLADESEPAIISGGEDSEELSVTTYGELDRLASRVANGLVARGFAPGDAVALYMSMNLECVAAYLGIVLAGLRVVSIADSFPPNEVRQRAEIGNARAVVTADGFLRAGKWVSLYEKVIAANAPQVHRALQA